VQVADLKKSNLINFLEERERTTPVLSKDHEEPTKEQKNLPTFYKRSGGTVRDLNFKKSKSHGTSLKEKFWTTTCMCYQNAKEIMKNQQRNRKRVAYILQISEHV
jgi:hypothetical protein